MREVFPENALVFKKTKSKTVHAEGMGLFALALFSYASGMVLAKPGIAKAPQFFNKKLRVKTVLAKPGVSKRGRGLFSSVLHQICRYFAFFLKVKFRSLVKL